MPAMKPEHFSALALGVTAIGVLAAIWYYRNAQNAAANATAQQPMPLFQTAAIPTAGGGVSTGAGGSSTTPAGTTTGTVTPTGMSADQLAAIASSQVAGNTQTTMQANSITGENVFAAETAGLVSQMISQLPSAQPGGGNYVNLAFTGANGIALGVNGSWNSSIPPYYQPPTGPVPLAYATPQGSVIAQSPPPPAAQFTPLPAQAAPFISPPFMRTTFDPNNPGGMTAGSG